MAPQTGIRKMRLDHHDSKRTARSRSTTLARKAQRRAKGRS